MVTYAFLGLTLLFISCSAKIYFEETFSKGFDHWKYGKKDGKFEIATGKYFDPENEDSKGLKTVEDAKHYSLSHKTENSFSNKDKDIIIQYQVAHEQNIDCGGGYIKVLPHNLAQKEFEGESYYYIMFGPDICGSSTQKVHVILGSKKGDSWKYYQVDKEIKCKTDALSHVYTLTLKKDHTYIVEIDGEKVESGSIETDFKFPPKQIDDSSVKKPEDWDDRPKIPDPEDKKPEDWEKPEKIPDPNAKKPEDWDDEMDGTWEAPMIDNPDYKGEWKPKMIDNPNYKKWIPPQIDNPDYIEVDELLSFDNMGTVGIDLWQVKSGTIYDNIIITDDKADAEKYLDLWKSHKDAEKEKHDKLEEEERKKSEEKMKDSTDKKDEEEDDDEDEETDPSDMPTEETHDEL